jgi:DNA repair protein RecO (recombination protein O)
MGLHRTRAVVIGRRALGESDRLVEFYTRDFGKLRGVAKAARRPRSRFTSALEPFTLGELIFFDTGRSELVRVDRFEPVNAFLNAREHLERLGHAAWAVECVTRLSADRDPHAALYGLLVRALEALDRAAARPAWVGVCFALRAVDLLGHRPRIDRCVSCGRAYPFGEAWLDIGAGGLVCGRCRAGADAFSVSGPAVGTLRRLRGLAWREALALHVASALADELASVVDGVITRLAGQPPRSSRFMAQLRRSLPDPARRR